MTANPKNPCVKDLTYRKSFRGRSCWNCGGNNETVVGAHIRWGHTAGMGMKNDQYIVPLCWLCHYDQEARPGPEWWANCLKNMAKRAYWDWRAGAGW